MNKNDPQPAPSALNRMSVYCESRGPELALERNTIDLASRTHLSRELPSELESRIAKSDSSRQKSSLVARVVRVLSSSTTTCVEVRRKSGLRDMCIHPS
jgi:hypothetical protein